MTLTGCRSNPDCDAARCILVAKLDGVEITDLVDSALFKSSLGGSSDSSGRAAVVDSVNVVCFIARVISSDSVIELLSPEKSRSARDIMERVRILLLEVRNVIFHSMIL